MSQHQARIQWTRGVREPFTDLRYNRAHTWTFDGGMTLAASSAPTSVPLPYSKPENVDPEEAFVAALSACHMLTFIWLAAKTGFVVDGYDDVAIGVMSANANGKMAMTSVQLEPTLIFSGAKLPTDAQVAALHHDAHAQCFIANSVLTTVTVSGKWHAL